MKQKYRFKQTEIGKIPEDWGITSFGKILVGNIKHGIYKSKEFFHESGIKILKMGLQYSNDRIGNQKMERVILTESELERFRINEDDLIFSRTSMMSDGAGTCSLVVKHEDPIVFDGNLLCAELDKRIAYPEFYFYFFNSKVAKYEISKITTGTQSRNIAGSSLVQLSVPLPIVQEQRAIASILSSLDAKIELNRQMNATLEKMAETLFRHWFVDFEFPDEKGRPYRSSGGKMVDSELGKIPKGWGVGTLGEICEITMGQSPPGETYNETGAGLPFYQGISDFGFRFPSRRVYCTAPTRFAEENNVLLSVRAPVGSLNVAEERCAIGRGVASLRLKGKQSGYFYYLLRATQPGWNKFEAEGTVFGSVGKSDVHEFKVMLPPEDLRERFGSLIGLR